MLLRAIRFWHWWEWVRLYSSYSCTGHIQSRRRIVLLRMKEWYWRLWRYDFWLSWPVRTVLTKGKSIKSSGLLELSGSFEQPSVRVIFHQSSLFVIIWGKAFAQYIHGRSQYLVMGISTWLISSTINRGRTPKFQTDCFRTVTFRQSLLARMTVPKILPYPWTHSPTLHSEQVQGCWLYEYW